MTAASPARRSDGNTPPREALVAAALDLLEADGPLAISIRAVAARAGCSTMGLYTNFGSKNGLVDELYRLGFRRLNAAIASVPVAPDPRAELEALLVAYRAFAIGNVALYGVMFERAVPDFTPTLGSRQETTASFDRLASVAARWLSRGAAAPANADVAYLILATANGLIGLELVHVRWGGPVMSHLQDRDSAAVFVETIRLLLDGLEARSGGDR